MLKRYRLFGEKFEFDFEKKIVKFDNGFTLKELKFEKLDEYCKACRNDNRINKPNLLLMYTDLKNGKSKNWEFCEVFEDIFVS